VPGGSAGKSIERTDHDPAELYDTECLITEVDSSRREPTLSVADSWDSGGAIDGGCFGGAPISVDAAASLSAGKTQTAGSDTRSHSTMSSVRSGVAATARIVK
jgi:hypothetical protein